MLSALLIAAAVALFVRIDAAQVRKAWEWCRSRIDSKMLLAAALVLAAILLLPSWGSDSDPTPVPDAGPLSLIAAFSGPTASDDALLVGHLLLELADEIEFDGSQAEPELLTGVQIDHLRKTARVLRCRGESVGERQPVARDRIAEYLEAHVGTDGGPMSPEQRAAWVSAFRDVGRAATDAAK